MNDSTVLLNTGSVNQVEKPQLTLNQLTINTAISPCQFYHCKSRPSELPRLSSIKDQHITIGVKQPPSQQPISLDPINLSKKGYIQSDLNEQPIDKNLHLQNNLFKDHNHSLYQIDQVQFDPSSQQYVPNKFLQDDPSIKLNHKDISRKQENKINDYDHEKFSSKSGTTIIDLQSEQQLSSIKLQNSQQTHEKMKNQTKQRPSQIISFNPTSISQVTFNISKHNVSQIPQKPKRNHNKNCPESLSVFKEKQFVVPIIQNTLCHNKSRYKQKEYLNINDQNLTKFFTAKDKKSYLENVLSNSSTFLTSNLFKSDLHSNCENLPNKMSKFYLDQSKNINRLRSSVLCQANGQAKCQNIDQGSGFGNVKIQNTKFLVKMSPSEKNKMFFNLSYSTLINHNYRPLTSKKKQTLTKLFKQSQQRNLNNFSERKSTKPQTTQFKQTNLYQNDIKRSCDYWAQINSYKKMGQNSERNKKWSNPQLQQLSRHQTDSDKIKKAKSEQYLEQNKQNFLFSSQKKSTLQKQQIQRKYKNLTIFEVEKIRQNNIKRIRGFQRSVMQKLNIVTKMGVKLPAS